MDLFHVERRSFDIIQYSSATSQGYNNQHDPPQRPQRNSPLLRQRPPPQQLYNDTIASTPRIPNHSQTHDAITTTTTTPHKSNKHQHHDDVVHNDPTNNTTTAAATSLPKPHPPHLRYHITSPRCQHETQHQSTTRDSASRDALLAMRHLHERNFRRRRPGKSLRGNRRPPSHWRALYRREYRGR